MNAWRNLTRSQQLLLAIGVPIAALAALVISRRQRAAAAEPAPTAPDPTGTITMGDTGDTGALADWSVNFTAALADLSQQIADLESRPTTTPPPTPAPATGNPLAPSSVPKSQLGRRQTTSRKVQPPGRGIPGETMSEISRRVYGDRGYWNYVRYFNPKKWPGSPDKTVPAGTVIYY